MAYLGDNVSYDDFNTPNGLSCVDTNSEGVGGGRAVAGWNHQRRLGQQQPPGGRERRLRRWFGQVHQGLDQSPDLVGARLPQWRRGRELGPVLIERPAVAGAVWLQAASGADQSDATNSPRLDRGGSPGRPVGRLGLRGRGRRAGDVEGPAQRKEPPGMPGMEAMKAMKKDPAPLRKLLEEAPKKSRAGGR
jgi:hypothetical protein